MLLMVAGSVRRTISPPVTVIASVASAMARHARLNGFSASRSLHASMCRCNRSSTSAQTATATVRRHRPNGMKPRVDAAGPLVAGWAQKRGDALAGDAKALGDLLHRQALVVERLR